MRITQVTTFTTLTVTLRVYDQFAVVPMASKELANVHLESLSASLWPSSSPMRSTKNDAKNDSGSKRKSAPNLLKWGWGPPKSWTVLQ